MTNTLKHQSIKSILAISSMVLLSSIGTMTASAETVSTICPYSWNQNLKVGSTGEDVLRLQQFLNASPDTRITETGLGAPGQETRKYGTLTAKAISKFQEKYRDEILSPAGLTKGTGSVLKQTRAKLNALCKSAPAVEVKSSEISAAPKTEVVVADALTIIKPEQPAQTIAPADAGSVPFTEVTLVAGSKDITVNSLTVERVGAGADGSIYSISVYNENGETIEEGKHLGADHRAKLGKPFVVPAYGSTTLSIMANMNSPLTDYEGQMPALQVVSIDASSPLIGELPLRGTAQIVNSNLVIGSANVMVSQFDPSTATNHYINDKNVRFSGIRLTAHSEEVLRLASIVWEQMGTASESDLENVVTVVDGVSYPTKVHNRSYTTYFDPQIKIQKGHSIDVYIQGDIKASAANRTVKFDIRKSDYLWLIGDSYGFDVLVYPEANTATSGESVFTTSDGTVDGTEIVPFFSGSTVTINGGTIISIGK